MRERNRHSVGAIHRLKWAVSALAALAVITMAPQSVQAADPVLYSIARSDKKLRSIDPATGKTLSEVKITLDGPSFSNGTGLASAPTTGRLLAILKRDDPFSNRMLVYSLIRQSLVTLFIMNYVPLMEIFDLVALGL